MADVKFEDFDDGGEMQVGDIPVGLRTSDFTKNFKFDFPGAGLKDSSGNYLFEYDTAGALAVNHLKLVSGLTTDPAVITADGSDADIDISIQPKGAGVVFIDEIQWPSAAGAVGTFMYMQSAGVLGFTATAVALSVEGTEDQVLVNGTFGTPMTGALVLTTPQDIGTTSTPTFGGLTLTTPLALTSGGTSKSLTASAGGIVWTDADSMEILAGTATANQLLLSGNLASPSWSTSTYPATNAINTLLYASAANVMSALATVNSASLSTNATGVPTWLALTDGQFVIGSTAGAPAAGTITAGTGISVTPGVNTLTVAATSGSGSPLTTKGDLYTFSTINDRLAVGGIDGQILQVDAAAATGLAWSTTTYPATTTINELLYSSSANVVSGLVTANSAMLYTDSSGVPAWSGSMTDGQVMIGATGASPAPATLTPGTGISIANSANGIQISATGGGFGVATIAGTSQAAAVNTMYIALNAGQTTVTLPSTFSVGDTVIVVGSGANAGGWIITANTGDTIMYNGTATSAGGTVTSSALAGQTVELVADVANTSWVIVDTVNTLLTTA